MYTLLNIFYNLSNTCVNFYEFIDKQISRNLKRAGIETRPAKSNGSWCCILLPMILNIYMLQYNVSPLYKLVATLSLGLLVHSVLFNIFVSVSPLALQEHGYGGCISCALIPILVMYTYLNYDLTFSIFYSVPFLMLFSWLICHTLINYPKTFTFGETTVLSQGAVLFTAIVIAKLSTNLDETDEEMDFIYAVIYTVFIAVAMIIIALCLLTEEQRTLDTLYYIFAVSGSFALLILHSTIGPDALLQVWHYLFVKNNRAQIFLFWLTLVGISVLVLSVRTQLAVKATTVARKVFHVLASLVFLSGILLDVNFITLAAGVGFALLILVEALRKSEIEPISSALQSVFLIYSDEKDSGCFAVSAMYLMAGLSLPLALCPGGARLARLAGVLAVGVGDSAAAWAGRNYGRHKWPGGNKTYEGTAFNILSQIATVYALLLFELLEENNALLRTSIAATVTGLVEAKTHQVDNLVLPLVTIIAFQSTWFLN